MLTPFSVVTLDNEDDVNITVGAFGSHSQDGSHHQSHNQDGSHHQGEILAHVIIFYVKMMMYNYFLSIIIYIET